MRFDPDHVLPAAQEYHAWRAARWPASARSWRVRRVLGRCVDVGAIGVAFVAVGIFGLADLVHGQPHVSTRLNWAKVPAPRLNRHVAKTHEPLPREPFADDDLDFLARFLVRQPEAARALDPELLAAVRRRQGGAR